MSSTASVDTSRLCKDTPAGFRFVTNVQPEGVASGDEIIAEMRKKYGRENVVVTTPAYTLVGATWNGRAVHVRKEVIDGA